MTSYNDIREDRNLLLKMWKKSQDEIRILKQRIKELEEE